ncbi:hypothetical protein ANCDUO_12961 [Ancylostoma duodenale]|uniref:Uncharacterized protein n=1 Tax=Ancylostoma duodenale TaxID=51022 RepID=A0A0C2GDE6_9BILA|nr:hypothetical protein ANCDUO_12961 [Ancylostoma duodenale]
MYNEALRDLKQEMDQEDRRSMSQKKGPIRYTAMKSGRMLEGDNKRLGKTDKDSSNIIITKAIVFSKKMELIQREWRTFAAFATCVLVWPIDRHPLKGTIENILRCII